MKWNYQHQRENSSGKAVGCFPKRPASRGSAPHGVPLLPACGEGLAVSLCLCWFHFSFISFSNNSAAAILLDSSGNGAANGGGCFLRAGGPLAKL